jgi:MOSC domain-containing protein YiiM
MSSGTVIAIYTTPIHGHATQPHHSVRVLPGLGIEDDRYFGPPGTPGKREGGGRDITLIEIEALQGLESEQYVHLEPGEARRNLVTQGATLNTLVGQEFQVGAVILRGIRLCEPCDHLAGMTDARVLPGLVHRGGLRAKILTEGVISVGDPISILSPGQV